MSRRRPSLSAYTRRRWRAIGAVVVILLGALLVLGMTDRGHDPEWDTRVGDIDQAVLAPDASVAYALVREADNVSALRALRGDTGEMLWEGPLNAPRAILAASAKEVAVATDFPLAFLTVYNADGSPRWQVPLEGNPVALAIEGEKLALALNAPNNPVLVFDGDLLIRAHHLPSPVRAVDLEAGLLATGGLQGEVVVYRDRDILANVTLPMGIRSLRLSADGTALVAGGFGFDPSDPRGEIAFLDLGAKKPLAWVQETPVGVGLVDIDEHGLFAMAVEEAPPTATVHVYDGATGATRWTRLLPGSVSRADSGALGGAAMAPDGSGVAVSVQRGRVLYLDMEDGSERWSYRAGGASVVTFGDEAPDRVLVGARLLENHPFDALLMFSASGEPISQRAPLLAGAILATAAVALALIVGVGFWWARRSY
ncbi:MAG TPA: PQQ-binding-like beta-propeller repeat protein [Candidatus Thermoplasmatota archaeon]|nr:PQQ-binding-like beta-propeller repeat protein [Candidatus Thermoplasmatota archaeon]